MDTNGPAAFNASPSDVFVCDKLPNSKLLDVFEILDGAHAVLGSIPFVHVLDLFARKTVALETKFQIPLSQRFAVFDLAPESGDGFVRVFHLASRTGVFVS